VPSDLFPSRRAHRLPPPSPSHPPSRAFPRFFPCCSRDDLHDLLTDSQYLDAFISTLPTLKSKLEEIDAIEETNEHLAQQNLALQPALAQLRAETLAAFNQAEELKRRWKEVEKEQASLYQVNQGCQRELGREGEGREERLTSS